MKDHEKEAGATRCADLPAGSKSGMYNLRGVGIRYCEMDWAGGGWTLCAHAGQGMISGGNRHWHSREAWGDHPHFKENKAEGSVCGLVDSMAYVLWQVADADLHPSSFEFLEVNWRGYAPDMQLNHASRDWPVQNDISIPYSDSSAVGLYPGSQTTWADSSEAFTEHFYITYSDLKRDNSNHDAAGVYAYELGAHLNGQHKHYEERCEGGGDTGDGHVVAGSIQMGAGGCVDHKHYPGGSRAKRGHVFIYYK